LREPFIVLDQNLVIKTANRSFYNTFKGSATETEGKFIYDLGNGQWDLPELRTLLKEVLGKGHPIHDFEVEQTFPAIGYRIMRLNARRVASVNSQPDLILLAIDDITDRHNAEIALRNSEIRFRRLFETAKDGILILESSTGRITDANPFISELLGYLLPQIFDLFTQAQRTLDRSQGGLGIGLTVVRKLIEMHGGTTEAHSSGLGQGSEFIVRLPALSWPARPAKIHATKRAQPVQTWRVLVVDDNADSADSIAAILETSGHEVEVAYSAQKALEMAVAHQPDIVLLDIGLPDMDGYEVAKHLRQTPELKEMRLIAVTGYGQLSDRQRSQEAGFDEHVVKPVEWRKLEELLTSLMKRPRRSESE